MEDIENQIPENTLVYSQNSEEVRVKTVKKDEKGVTETKIERIKVQQQKQTNIARPFSRSRLVENTICLSVEDLLQATAVQDCCWQAFKDVFFRRVLIYGKVVVLNIFTRDGKTRYSLSVDDGTGVINGIFSVSREFKTEGELSDGSGRSLVSSSKSLLVSNLSGRLTTMKNKLKRKEEVGFNIKGEFHPPDSPLCRSIVDSCRILHNSIANNLKAKRVDLRQGPQAEKALIFGNLFTNHTTGKIQFNIIDLSLNDHLELPWKRQLNKLYLKTYSKCP
jgi:hypothetical protein